MIDFDALVLQPCIATFGEKIFYLTGDGQILSVVGVFDEKFMETRFDHETQVEVATQRPMLSFRVAELGYGRPTLGEIFMLRARSYRVSDPPVADGQGHIRVPLQLLTDNDSQTPPGPPEAPTVILS